VQVSVVANGTQSARQDVTQVTRDERFAGHGHGFETVVGAVFPEERDGLLVGRNDAAVANDTARDIRAKITKGVRAGPRRMDVNAPVLAPHRKDRPANLWR